MAGMASIRTHYREKKSARILTVEVIIERSVEDVWQYLINPQHTKEYMANLSHASIELTNGINGNIQEGSNITYVDNYHRSFIENIVTVDEPNEIEGHFIAGEYCGSIEKIRLRDVEGESGGATLVKFQWEMVGNVFFRWLQRAQFYRNWYWRGKYATDFQTLKEILEKDNQQTRNGNGDGDTEEEQH
eukprot:CAMPEP_0197241036 /NCGR_PEP_ID=MMETSP1429-20130617/7180_1 /TAXON_ID=49237 /ORGANISM="Chaetoceros  sp., Strain UNC1202" /LENGTH=187 /DNA_ID=CAMNT_0042700799 /DNA_START=156 /DNA_END=719 /DNA_ORIENTATION=-